MLSKQNVCLSVSHNASHIINACQTHNNFANETPRGSDMYNAIWLIQCKVRRCTLFMPFSIEGIHGPAMERKIARD